MPDLRLPYEFIGPLRTDRLVLRPMTGDDVDDVHAYQSRADVCRYLTFEPRTREEVAERIARYSTALTLNGDGDFWQIAIERASRPGRVIGDVFFTIRSTANATGEIGWTLHPDCGGHGYMTEAAGAILELAFASLRLHRVCADLDPRNAASIALCERLGMRKEAHFVEDLWFKGHWGDTTIYAILGRSGRQARRRRSAMTTPPTSRRQTRSKVRTGLHAVDGEDAERLGVVTVEVVQRVDHRHGSPGQERPRPLPRRHQQRAPAPVYGALIDVPPWALPRHSLCGSL